MLTQPKHRHDIHIPQKFCWISQNITELIYLNDLEKIDITTNILILKISLTSKLSDRSSYNTWKFCVLQVFVRKINKLHTLQFMVTYFKVNYLPSLHNYGFGQLFEFVWILLLNLCAKLLGCRRWLDLDQRRWRSAWSAKGIMKVWSLIFANKLANANFDLQQSRRKMHKSNRMFSDQNTDPYMSPSKGRQTLVKWNCRGGEVR